MKERAKGAERSEERTKAFRNRKLKKRHQKPKPRITCSERMVDIISMKLDQDAI